ncbi:MAG: hypothetical protein ABR509_05840 [Candidatus Limnocylindria bacterium]
MRGWLARGGRAASVAASAPELWIAGALSELVSVGWLPLLAAVPLPSPSDAAFLVASIAGRREFPLLIGALISSAIGAVLLGNLARALCDAVVFGGVAALPPEREATQRRTGIIWVAELIALAPTAAALLVLGYLAVTVAPAEWQSPDIGGRTVVARVVAALAPGLALLALALLVGDGLRSAAIRQVIAGALGPRAALRGAVMDLAAGRWSAIGLAIAALLLRAAYLGFAYALLRALWQPLGRQAASGALLSLPGAPLLLGFVFVWLCLTLGSGGLRTWLAGWWTAVLADGRLRRGRREVRRPAWTRRPSSN